MIIDLEITEPDTDGDNIYRCRIAHMLSDHSPECLIYSPDFVAVGQTVKAFPLFESTDIDTELPICTFDHWASGPELLFFSMNMAGVWLRRV